MAMPNTGLENKGYREMFNNVYERLLGMSLTPWSERGLADRDKSKAVSKEGRSKAGEDRVAGAGPCHKLSEYAGEYEHPAYGVMKIRQKTGDSLEFDFQRHFWHKGVCGYQGYLCPRE
jgi:hypothetical protein